MGHAAVSDLVNPVWVEDVNPNPHGSFVML